MKGKLYNKQDLIEDGKNTNHFNDLLRSSCYTPYYSWSKQHWKQIHFTIGAEAPCMCCGKSYIAVTDDMLCTDCELDHGSSEDEMFTTCDCCGRRILYNESYCVEPSGETVCESCADSECKHCDCCGELYYNSDIRYDRENEEYRCPSCHSDARRERENFMRATAFFI